MDALGVSQSTENAETDALDLGNEWFIYVINVSKHIKNIFITFHKYTFHFNLNIWLIKI